MAQKTSNVVRLPSAQTKRRRKKIHGIVVGRIVDLSAAGEPLVLFEGIRTPVVARTTVSIGPQHKEREVTLQLERGDPARPIITGLLDAPADVTLDGERLVLTAHREIVLQCGEASITLTVDGRILIKGAYLLQRSYGVNRIKGASVQIN